LIKQKTRIAKKTELVADYRERFANPYVAASAGFIDNVIEPHETRPRLINSLEMLRNKQASLPAQSTATSRSEIEFELTAGQV
jgi:acetyl-CoA carboxylase carboxyltransferase component